MTTQKPTTAAKRPKNVPQAVAAPAFVKGVPLNAKNHPTQTIKTHGISPTIIIGYARVSTAGQSTDAQVEALIESGCMELFVDNAVSGAKNDRSPYYRALMDRVKEVRALGFPVIVRVTKLDRFSRSVLNLAQGVQELGNMDAAFEVLNGGFNYNPKDPSSKLTLHVLGAFAEFERDLIKSRMADGRDAKREKGQIFGRRPVLNAAAVKAIRADYVTGEFTDRKLAADWKVSRNTIQRVLNIAGYTKPYIDLDTWEKAKKDAA